MPDHTALIEALERAADHERLVFEALHEQLAKQAIPYAMYSSAYDVTAYRRAALLEHAAALRAKGAQS